MRGVRRREVLRGVMGLALAATLPVPLGCGARAQEPKGDPLFVHGVASGDPLPDAVILWTRVTSKADLAVSWEIATDVAFAAVVGSGQMMATADRDHTVKVDARGLSAGTTYYYRFRALGQTSPVGRTRTAPTAATRLRFAVVSCSSLPHGFFHVYRAIAERADIDAVLHLGDYIYEYEEEAYGTLRASEPATKLTKLEDYRTRYAQYRRDADLQEVHRQHPFVCTWDDHELSDNTWKAGAGNHSAEDDGAWEERKRAAQRAYSEWIPVRDQPDGRIWRSLRYGDLAELVFLDTRVWGREQQAVDDKDPTLADPARQMLGQDQEAWLTERLRGSTSRWKLVCQQVMMAPLPTPLNTDQWDGYPGARARFYDVLEKTPVNDVVVLSGDVHSSWACDLARTPSDPLVYDGATGKGSLAVELVAPAVSSPGPETTETPEGLVAKNPWMKYVDLQRRGFILLDLDEARAQGAWFHVASISKEERVEATFSAAFATYAGENRLRPEPGPAAPTANPPALAPAPTLAAARI